MKDSIKDAKDTVLKNIDNSIKLITKNFDKPQ
jgi:hypothetical protein